MCGNKDHRVEGYVRGYVHTHFRKKHVSISFFDKDKN